MHPALRHALHHRIMSLHAPISLNSGFRSMPLPDEIAVRLPPPPPLSLCNALYLHAGACAHVRGQGVPACITLRLACRLVWHTP